MLKYMITLGIAIPITYEWMHISLNWGIVIPLKHSLLGNENDYYNTISFHLISFSMKAISFLNHIVIPHTKHNLRFQNISQTSTEL